MFLRSENASKLYEACELHSNNSKKASTSMIFSALARFFFFKRMDDEQAGRSCVMSLVDR